MRQGKCIHLMRDDDKRYAVGFAEADRPGPVAWRSPSAEAAGSAGGRAGQSAIGR